MYSLQLPRLSQYIYSLHDMLIVYIYYCYCFIVIFDVPINSFEYIYIYIQWYANTSATHYISFQLSEKFSMNEKSETVSLMSPMMFCMGSTLTNCYSDGVDVLSVIEILLARCSLMSKAWPLMMALDQEHLKWHWESTRYYIYTFYVT